jgi:hypothetical protein
MCTFLFTSQLVIDFCFAIDIILHLRTTVLGPAEQGSVVITDLSVIWQAYTKFPNLHRGFFLYDLLACLPIDLVAFWMPGGVLGIYGQFLRLNRLLHGLRIVSVHGGQIMRLTRKKKIAVRIHDDQNSPRLLKHVPSPCANPFLKPPNAEWLGIRRFTVYCGFS